MVLWKKLWYFGQNYGTILRTMNFDLRRKKTWWRKKTWLITKKIRDFELERKKLCKYTKIIEVLNRFIALEL